jgi:coenzyme F420-0:L-glutamate ligase / coenzyme F420-1:gamma-L-glutamate ligase
MPASMAFYDVVEGRQSIREFSDEPVDRLTLARLLQAACLAPSAHNRQPWRFVVLTDARRRSALADAMTSRLTRDRTADGDPRDAIEADVARARRRLSDAPVAILVCLDPESMDGYPDERRGRAEWTMMAQSVAMAGENLLLAAHAEGLGACWMCSPLFAPDEVRDVLGLPDAWEPQGMVLLGHRQGNPPRRPRRALDEVTRWA